MSETQRKRVENSKTTRPSFQLETIFRCEIYRERRSGFSEEWREGTLETISLYAVRKIFEEYLKEPSKI